jgi:hypothetical protein
VPSAAEIGDVGQCDDENRPKQSLQEQKIPLPTTTTAMQIAIKERTCGPAS